jgi:hypothetical protein
MAYCKLKKNNSLHSWHGKYARIKNILKSKNTVKNIFKSFFVMKNGSKI